MCERVQEQDECEGAHALEHMWRLETRGVCGVGSLLYRDSAGPSQIARFAGQTHLFSETFQWPLW